MWIIWLELQLKLSNSSLWTSEMQQKTDGKCSAFEVVPRWLTTDLDFVKNCFYQGVYYSLLLQTD